MSKQYVSLRKPIRAIAGDARGEVWIPTGVYEFLREFDEKRVVIRSLPDKNKKQRYVSIVKKVLTNFST